MQKRLIKVCIKVDEEKVDIFIQKDPDESYTTPASTESEDSNSQTDTEDSNDGSEDFHIPSQFLDEQPSPFLSPSHTHQKPHLL